MDPVVDHSSTKQILLWILGIITFGWIARIYSKSDGKKGMSKEDFQKFLALIIFVGAFVWIMYAEFVRTTVYHTYDGTWMAMVITGLFSVLHMERVIELMIKLLEVIIRLRTGAKITTTEQVIQTEQKVEQKIVEQVKSKGSDETPA